jgi:hypothetical protein
MKPPLSVTFVALIFIIAGCAGIIYHWSEWRDVAERSDVIWPFVLRLFAIVGGILILRGINWSRYLLVAWMLYHIYISLHHTTMELIIHIIVTIVVVVLLFNKKTALYFKR